MNIQDVFTKESTYNGRPLDNEAELIEAAKGGDSAAYYALAMQYANVLRGAVSRYADFDGQDVEDARASVLAALWAAVVAYEGGSFAALLPRFVKADATHVNSAADFMGSDSGISPQTERLYWRAIRATETVEEAREYATSSDRKNSLSGAHFDAIHSHLRADDVTSAQLVDVAETANPFSSWELANDVSTAIDGLPTLQRAIVRRSYGFDGTASEDVNTLAQVFPAVHSDREVSGFVNVSRATVERHRKAAIEALREPLAAYRQA